MYAAVESSERLREDLVEAALNALAGEQPRASARARPSMRWSLRSRAVCSPRPCVGWS
jgi:hypothetical protein